MTGTLDVSGEISGGTANITNNLTVGGNLTVSQTSYLADVEMTGNLSVGGSFVLTNTDISNNLTVGGNLTVS